MCLKKSRLFVFVYLIILFSFPTLSKENRLIDTIDYLNNLNNFSASFVQNNNYELSEGDIFISQDRIRVEYNLPSQILIILSNNRAMYYNFELDEDEFFNPKDSLAWFFIELFKNPNFFLDADIETKNKNYIIKKDGYFDDIEFSIKVSFEEMPTVIRKIEVKFDGNNISLSLFNHQFDRVFNKNFFKLINPKFFKSKWFGQNRFLF